MKNTCAVLFACSVLWSQHAHAEDGSDGRGLGVGAEVAFGADAVSPDVLAAGAITGVYDVGAFHFDALLLLAANDAGPDAFGVVGRFYYIVHRSKSADFSVGAGGGIISTDAASPGNNRLGIIAEGGGKIRAFIVPNVALTVTIGVGMRFIENASAFSTFGRPVGGAGLVYFF